MKAILEFYNCDHCPLHFYLMEQGCCGDFCKLIPYGQTPYSGIREDCPLKDMEKWRLSASSIDGIDGSIQVIEK